MSASGTGEHGLRLGKRTGFAIAVLAAMGTAAACGSSSSDDGSTDAGNPGDATTQPGNDAGGNGSPDATIANDASGDDTGRDSSAGDDATSDAAVDAADAALPTNLEAGASCTTDDECLSGGCDTTGHCATDKSCTQQNGGWTCGPDGGESCCETIHVDVPDGGITFDAGELMPSQSYSLDKFSVTAGRFRVFIEKTQGHVRDYVQAHRASWWDPAWDSWVPNVMDDGTQITGASHVFPDDAGKDGVYQQLGPIHFGTEGPGNEGCLTKEVGNARTFRLPDSVNATDFNDVQQYDAAVLDTKPMQCATFYMLAAFCLWDDARPPTEGELNYAWDHGQPAKHVYPWGNTPVPAGWDYPFDDSDDAKTYGKITPDGGDQTYANHLYNWWSPDTISGLNNDAAACDYSVYLAPPGRFPKGDGPFGHSDLAGGVYSIAMPLAGQDAGPDQLQAGLLRTGAFDGHAIPATHPKAGFSAFLATNKYLAIGVRCARDQ